MWASTIHLPSKLHFHMATIFVRNYSLFINGKSLLMKAEFHVVILVEVAYQVLNVLIFELSIPIFP
jgi:hypothetical protein